MRTAQLHAGEVDVKTCQKLVKMVGCVRSRFVVNDNLLDLSLRERLLKSNQITGREDR